MDQNEFERDYSIDPNQLDVECVRQPEVFFKWAQKAIDARGNVDRLKLRLEVIKATLELKARDNPEDFGIEGRATEAAVNAAVLTHERYLKASKRLSRAKSDSAMLDKAVDAMEMKKRMLEVLVTLHGQSYFAGPKVARDLGKAWLNQQRASEARLNQRVAARVAIRRKG